MTRVFSLTLALVIAAAGGALAGPHIVGGTPGAADHVPWGGQDSACRFQCMWYQSEINEAGRVTKVEFQFRGYASGSPPITFNNVDMLLCHSSLNALTNNFQNNYDGKTPVKVYSGNFKIPAGLNEKDWFIQCEPNNFTYNNKDNLLFEISWSRNTASLNTFFWLSISGQPGRLYAENNKTATTGVLVTKDGQIARITISNPAVEATSLGRVKTLFR